MDGIDCPAEIKAEILDEPDEVFLILPRNVDVWRAFLIVCTQLKFSEAFGWTGFDYCGVESGLKMAGISLTEETFAQLRIVEAETIKQLNQRLKQ